MYTYVYIYISLYTVHIVHHLRIKKNEREDMFVCVCGCEGEARIIGRSWNKQSWAKDRPTNRGRENNERRSKKRKRGGNQRISPHTSFVTLRRASNLPRCLFLFAFHLSLLRTDRRARDAASRICLPEENEKCRGSTRTETKLSFGWDDCSERVGGPKLLKKRNEKKKTHKFGAYLTLSQSHYILTFHIQLSSSLTLLISWSDLNRRCVCVYRTRQRTDTQD